MPEHFNISLITNNTTHSRVSLENCINEKTLGSKEDRMHKSFNGRNILVTTIENDEVDYCEIYISIPDQVFHREIFESELEIFTEFVKSIFECDGHVKYALCSYELNGYILSGVNSLNMFNDELLSRFPIVYKRAEGGKSPLVYYNLQAQDIFV